MSIVIEIKEQIKKLNAQLKDIQDSCNHPESCVEKKNGSNTGNYDPHADCYWTDYYCKLCEKKWTKYK